MPIDPAVIKNIGSGYGISPTQSPSPENVLMAAADMHKMGRLSPDPQPTMPSANDKAPAKIKQRHRGMKVVK